MTVIRTTGLYSVVASDGPLPYWVEVRTHNKAPLVGPDIRVRGFDTEERAVRFMKRATREAIQNDPSLKRFLSSDDGATMPPASSKQGKRPSKKKPGPVPQPKDLSKAYPFVTTRFVLDPSCSNPVAQVWRCQTNTAAPRGKAIGKGSSRPANDLPHRRGECAVTRLITGKLYTVVDEDGMPIVFSDYRAAEQAAVALWKDAPEPKLPIDGRIYYSNSRYEVHLMPAESASRPFCLFEKVAQYWVLDQRGAGTMKFARLDNAIEEADRMDANYRPPSVRLISALIETPAEKAERLLREEAFDAEMRRREEEMRRLYEEDQRELAEISRRNRERMEKRGGEVLSLEESRALSREAQRERARNQIKNPTPEQKAQARRSKYVRRAYSDQMENDDG